MKNIKNKKPGYICLEEMVLLLLIPMIIFAIIPMIKNQIEKPISTDISVVEVEVVETIYKKSYVSTSYVAVDDKGTMIPIDTTYPEKFITVIKHQDHTHSLYGKETYAFCYGKDGTSTKANVYVDTYKSGEQKHTIEIILE